LIKAEKNVFFHISANKVSPHPAEYTKNSYQLDSQPPSPRNFKLLNNYFNYFEGEGILRKLLSKIAPLSPLKELTR